ncbi:MAG: hypothetical protein J0L86_16665 [Flavobacteriales bacterium]|nr:hypothetical protein [Flavobacteriales bacterium]
MDTLSIKRNTTNPTQNILKYGKKLSEERYMKIKLMKQLESLLYQVDLKENTKIRKQS